MEFQFYISAAAVSAVTAAITSVIVALITRKTTLDAAKEAANQEINKLERTWDREDLVSSDEEFAEMAQAVATYVSVNSPRTHIDAAEKVAAIRSKEYGEMGRILDSLYENICNVDRVSADRELSKAINEKRRIKEASSNAAKR